MCAPFIVDSVRRKALSRRGFIGAAVTCAVAASVPARAQQKPVRLPNGFRDVVDLTHTFSPSLPAYPGYRPVQIRSRTTVAQNGYANNEITCDEHTGTHLDAPSHFVVGAMSAERLPVDRLIAPLVVISVVNRAAKDSDTLVSVDDLRQWERRHGRVPAGAFVAMHSGWDARASDADRFLNRDAKGTLHADTASSCWRISAAPRRRARRSSLAHPSTSAGPAVPHVS
ncbi:MAG TPA: cyclase family protein [Vicinamibacterales bacterium]|nr:cyclase family protein [Vicinamibacterales bacterium]